MKFNSPNDIVIRSDNSIYWTDSAGGVVIPGMVAQDVQRYIDVQGVYRRTPDGKRVQLVVADCTYPNGLAFTPDEKQLTAGHLVMAAAASVTTPARRQSVQQHPSRSSSVEHSDVVCPSNVSEPDKRPNKGVRSHLPEWLA